MSEEQGGSRRARLLRALLIVVVAVLVLWLLFTQVFPRVERYLEDPTLEAVAVEGAIGRAVEGAVAGGELGDRVSAAGRG